MRTSNISANYVVSEDQYFKAGYTNTNSGSIDQLTFEGEWPVNENVSVFGIERYGLEESENLQTRIGIEYDACCWRFRVAADRLRKTNDETRNSIFAEFELTGIGKVDTSTDF